MKNIFTFIFILVFFISQIYAQKDTIITEDLFEMSFEELLKVKVFTSSREFETIDDAPNVIYVITAKDIKQRGLKTYKDILLGIPGINIFLGDLGYFTQIRGIAPNSHNKVTYMINGRQVNQITEANMLSGPVSFDNVERVEVIVGPGAVLYGAETLLALLNIVTKKEGKSSISVNTGQDLNEKANALGHIRTNVSIMKKWENNKFISFSFSGIKQQGWSAFDTINFFNPNNNNHVGKLIMDQYKPSYHLFANGEFDEFGFQYSSYNGTLTDIGRESRQGTKGKRYDKVNDFMITHKKNWNNIINSRIQFNYADKRFARAVTEGFHQNEDLAQDIYNIELAVNFRYDKHYLQFGSKYEHIANKLNYLIGYDPLDPSVAANEEVQQFIKNGYYQTFGFYISEKWNIIDDKFILIAASRLDRNTILEEEKWYFSPRVALIGKPTSYWTSKLFFNTSTHMPDTRQSTLNMVYGLDNINTVPPIWAQSNPLVHRPERLTAYEFQNIFTFKKHRIIINAYYQELSDFISWFNPSTNMGDFTGYGSELYWQGEFSKMLSCWSNISYTASDFELTANKFRESSNFPSNDDGESVSVPKIQANIGVNMNFTENISLSLTGRYFTMQPAYFITYDATNLTNYRKQEWGYINNQFYLDANLLFQNVIIKDLNLSLKIENLTNNQNLIAAQYRKYRYAPRGISALFTVKFSF